MIAETPMLDAASEYRCLGLSVIPVGADKKPLVEWRPYQDEPAHQDQIDEWWSRWPEANIGIVTGAVSGLVALDADGPEGLESLKSVGTQATTWLQKTARGYHQFFRHPGGDVRIGNRAGILPGLDVRGDGGYVVVPPSRHSSGVCYRWLTAPDKIALADLPEHVLDLLSAPQASNEEAAPRGGAIPEGRRNDTLYRLARSLVAKGLSAQGVRAALTAENLARCRPPLTDREVRDISEHALRQPDRPAFTAVTREGLTMGAVDSGNCENTGHGVEAPWGPTIPFQEFNLLAFPTHALPDWVAQFVEELATATQTPTDLPAMVVLSVLAAALATKIEVEVKPGYVEPVNVYTVTAMEPGNRKSAVFAEAVAPLEEREKEEAGRLKQEMAEAQALYRIAEARLKKAQDAAAAAKADEVQVLEDQARQYARELAEITVPSVPRLLADDISPERVATLLRDNGSRIAILSAEGDIFDLMAGRYSNGVPNLGVFLKGHAGDALRVDRVGRAPEYVARPAVTIGLTVQPEVLRGLIDKPGFRGRGLLGRFLYALPASLMGRRDVNAQPMSARTRAVYRERVRALLDVPSDVDDAGNLVPRRLDLAPGAFQAWRDFERWLEPQLARHGDLGHMTDWAGKLAGAVVRIAGLLHVAENAERSPWAGNIEGRTMERAVTLGHYLIAHARAAFAEMGADPTVESARFILGWIERNSATTLTLRDIYQGTKGRFKKVDALKVPVAILIEHGFVREVTAPAHSGAGRRPSPVYEVNPKRSAPRAHNSHNPQNPSCGQTEAPEAIAR